MYSIGYHYDAMVTSPLTAFEEQESLVSSNPLRRDLEDEERRDDSLFSRSRRLWSESVTDKRC